MIIRVWNKYGTKIKLANVPVDPNAYTKDDLKLLEEANCLVDDENAFQQQVHIETRAWEAVAKEHSPLTKDLIGHISTYLVKNRPLERGDRNRYPRLDYQQNLIRSWQNDVWFCIAFSLFFVSVVLLIQTLVYFSAPMNSIVSDCNTMPGPTGHPGTCTGGYCQA